MKRIILIIGLLALGVTIYRVYSPNIWLFGITGSWNEHTGIPTVGIDAFIRNYIPDFLWAMALLNTTHLLKSFKTGKFCVYALFALPFFSEILQFFKCIPGTFDWYDLLVYILAFFLFFNSKIFVMKRSLNLCIGPMVLLLFILSILACATTHTYKTPPEKPGFYGITEQWNSGVGDINGEVGHSLFVSSPRARCLPGQWTANRYIVSGTLPPGLTLNSGPSTITGIPTERGHWIVKIKMYDISCNDKNFDGCCSFTQELRFHISGSGKVNF